MAVNYILKCNCYGKQGNKPVLVNKVSGGIVKLSLKEMFRRMTYPKLKYLVDHNCM